MNIMRIMTLIFCFGLLYSAKGQELFKKHETTNTYAFSISDSLPNNVSLIAGYVLNKFYLQLDTIVCLPDCMNPLHVKHPDFDSYYFKHRSNFIRVYFSKNRIDFSEDTIIEVNNKIANTVPNKIYYSYGFSLFSSDRKKVEQNIVKLFLSSLNQELNKDYASNQENFISLKPKSKGVFWKRNMLNMAYGVSYIKKQNPFANYRHSLTVSLGIIECAYYYPIFVLPFVADNKNDKIFGPIAGLSSLLFWKILVGLISNAEIKKYNRIIEANYKVPKTVRF